MKAGYKKGLILFVWAGLISAIGAYITHFFITNDLRSSVWVQVEALIVSGVVLTLAGLIFAKYPRSKRGLTVLQFLLFPLLGIGLAFLTLLLSTWLPIGNWEKLVQPPEQISGFIHSDQAWLHGDNLYVKGVTGNTYVYECQNAVECIWVQKEFGGSEAPNNPECEVGDFSTPVLPGKVIDSLSTAYCAADGRSNTKFILLEDNSIYHWSGTTSANDIILRLYGFVFFNIIAGLVVSFIVMKMRKEIA